MIRIVHRIAEILMHHHQHIRAVRRKNDAAVIPAGVHAAALGRHLKKHVVRIVAVHKILREISRDHAVVMLLLKDFHHLRVRFRTDQLPLRQPRKDSGVIAGRRGSQPVIPVKMNRIVKHRVPAAQLLNTVIDCIHAQIIDHDIGRNVIADDDHQRRRILHPQHRARVQRDQHAAPVHIMILPVRQQLIQARLPLLDPVKQRRQDIGLHGTRRLEFLICPHGNDIAVKVIGIDAREPVIAFQFRLNPFLQC